MKTCPRCSAQLRDQARFCSRCGAPQPEASLSSQPAVPDQAADPADVPAEIQPPPRKRIPPGWIIGIAGFVLLVAAGLWWGSRELQSSPPQTPTPLASSPNAELIPTAVTQTNPTSDPSAGQPSQGQDSFSAGETNIRSSESPLLSTPTVAATPMVISWYGEGESFSVLIRAGQVIDGEALGRLRWKATKGQYDGKFLVVTFTTEQTSGCAAEMTYTYQVTAQGLFLIQSADGCGNVDTSGNKAYLIR